MNSTEYAARQPVILHKMGGVGGRRDVSIPLTPSSRCYRSEGVPPEYMGWVNVNSSPVSACTAAGEKNMPSCRSTVDLFIRPKCVQNWKPFVEPSKAAFSARSKSQRPSTQRGPSSLGSTSRFTCILPFNECLTGYSVGISDSPNFGWTIYEGIPSFSIVPNIRIVPLDGSQSYHTISAFNQTVTQLFTPHRPRRLLGTWPHQSAPHEAVDPHEHDFAHNWAVNCSYTVESKKEIMISFSWESKGTPSMPPPHQGIRPY